MKTQNIFRLLLLISVVATFWSCEETEKEVPSALTINQQGLTFTGYSSTLSFKVNASRRWSAVASEHWFTITPDHYPSANENFEVNIAVTVADNVTDEVRNGYVIFYLQDVEMARVNITQGVQDDGDKPEEQYPITWANLQWNSGTTINEGDNFDAGSCVFADGITNVIKSTTGESITCEMGYSLSDTSPEGADWTWVTCPFNDDWGDNFYYQGRLAGLTKGVYYYSFRFRQGTGAYKYAGTGGLWDGTSNVNGKIEVKAVSGEGEGDGIDYSKLVVSWANIQWSSSSTITVGGKLEAGSKVLINNLTNLETPATAANSHITCEIGYSAANTNPSGSDWTWKSCPFSADWGTEYYYQGSIDDISVAGTYYYNFRYKIDSGAYVYAGSGGIWDGTSNVNGTFAVSK